MTFMDIMAILFIIFMVLAVIGGIQQTANKPKFQSDKLKFHIEPKNTNGVITANANKHKDYLTNKTETTTRKDRYNNKDILELIPELIIKYEDRSGVVTSRTLSNIRYKNSFQFNAYCHLRKEKRTFLNLSVISAANPYTNCAVEELSVKWGENGLRRTIYF